MSMLLETGNTFFDDFREFPLDVANKEIVGRGRDFDSIDQLNALLRGEISAAEAYRHMLDKLADQSHQENLGLLREIQDEHGRACQSLRGRIRELGGQAADSAGVWGVWTSAVQGSMSLLGGDKGGLQALKEGEEHGLKVYRDALAEIDSVSSQLVQNRLVPAQERHINLLDQLIKSIGRTHA